MPGPWMMEHHSSALFAGLNARSASAQKPTSFVSSPLRMVTGTPQGEKVPSQQIMCNDNEGEKQKKKKNAARSSS